MKLLVLAVFLFAPVPVLAQQVPGAPRNPAFQIPAGAAPSQVPNFSPGPSAGLLPDASLRKTLDTHSVVLKKLSARIDELEARLKELEARNGKKETR
jgi:hypothetical protein